MVKDTDEGPLNTCDPELNLHALLNGVTRLVLPHEIQKFAETDTSN